MNVESAVKCNMVYSHVFLVVVFILSVSSFFCLEYGYSSVFSALCAALILTGLIEESRFLSMCATADKRADKQKKFCYALRYFSVFCLLVSWILNALLHMGLLNHV